jgi:hypothetical protein
MDILSCEIEKRCGGAACLPTTYCGASDTPYCPLFCISPDTILPTPILPPLKITSKNTSSWPAQEAWPPKQEELPARHATLHPMAIPQRYYSSFSASASHTYPYFPPLPLLTTSPFLLSSLISDTLYSPTRSCNRHSPPLTALPTNAPNSKRQIF